MIEGIIRFLELSGKVFKLVGKFIPQWVPVTTLIWAVGFLLCYLLGGIALWRMGREGGYKKKGLAWIPGIQIYCEAAFSGKPHTARRIQGCLWWFWVVVVACLTDGIWMVVGYSGAEKVPEKILLIGLIALVILLLFLYLLIRADELTCLRKVLHNDWLWAFSIIGSIFCLPLQRVFLLFVKKEKNEDAVEEPIE